VKETDALWSYQTTTTTSSFFGPGPPAVLGSETARSYDKTGLRPASVLVLQLDLVLVLVLVLYFWSCLKHCCARQALCDMIMLKCNKHVYFCAISAETVPNVTGHHITF